jgi:predicted transcriptional regulator
LQFWGTFVTCQLLAQARQDAERAREETSQSLDQHRKIFQELMTDRQEARQLRGQLAMLREEWDNIQTRLKDAREREDPLEVRRQELSDLLGKEADRLIELIRREGMDHAAFLEAVIHEGYHGDAVNPLVPNPPRPGVID